MAILAEVTENECINKKHPVYTGVARIFSGGCTFPHKKLTTFCLVVALKTQAKST